MIAHQCKRRNSVTFQLVCQIESSTGSFNVKIIQDDWKCKHSNKVNETVNIKFYISDFQQCSNAEQSRMRSVCGGRHSRHMARLLCNQGLFTTLYKSKLDVMKSGSLQPLLVYVFIFTRLLRLSLTARQAPIIMVSKTFVFQISLCCSKKSESVHHNAVLEKLSPPPGLEKQRKESMTIRKKELVFNGLEDKENNEMLS